MNGNEQIIITSRDRVLSHVLARLRVLDGEQIKEIAGFRSTSVANARFLKLVRANILKRFFLPTRAGGRKSLYALSRKGARLIDFPVRLVHRPNDALLVGDQWIEHQLATNSILIQVKFRPIPVAGGSLIRSLTFPSVLSKAIPLIPDAYFELAEDSHIYPMFCEVDRGTETLSVWTKKTERYLLLATSGEFKELFQQSQFRVLVAANSSRRLEGIRKTIAKLTQKIFWFTTLEEINSDGLFAPIWLRPIGTDKQSLL
jgi:hypothetical protein